MARNFITKYNAKFAANLSNLEIELACIRRGGQWTDEDDTCGLGLFHHYREAQTLCWPEDDHHRWSDLMLKEILQNTITVVMGPKDSGKTHTASKYALIDYWAFPNTTLFLISSTDVRGLELRVWGDIKSLIQRARERYSWIPGRVIDSKHCVATDNIEESDIRDLRRGIITIPCLSSSGQYIGGLQKFAGVKQKRRRLIADELTFMRDTYLDVPSNMNTGDFKGIFLGNPLGIGDPLDKAGEPKDGWSSLPEPTKTTIWQNRWLDGHTVNLVGTDSPNFDFPQNKPAKYPYLINQKSIDRTVSFYGKDSLQYYSQCLGVRRAGLTAHRVITREMCEQFGAFEDVIWRGTKRTKVYGADIAYGGVGGDRCVGGWVEFGDDVDGNLILRINQHVIIPVSIRHKKIPEDQIAEFIKADCEANGIPPENVFYDSTGRGTMGTAFARIWSAFVNPVEFGGVPTPKPVCSDMYIFDVKTRENRLKRSDEHYSKRVTELWFNVRYAIESRQIRNLSQEVAEEGYLREWGMTRGDKIELETKADMKERIGHSPDLFDWLAVCIHGALQRGFSISKLGGKEDSADGPVWFKDLLDKSRKLNHAHDLVYADRLN